jgi:Trypsin-like peptidase domain
MTVRAPGPFSVTLSASCTIVALCIELGCVSEPTEEARVHVQAVIYGNDDRTDYHAHTSAVLRSRAGLSSVAIVDSNAVVVHQDGSTGENVLSLGERYDLCLDERFWMQPSIAFCSGVLVQQNMIVTAAHCLTVPCNRWRLIAGWHYSTPDAGPSASGGAPYLCAEVLAAHVSEGTPGPQFDYAWIRLDRPMASPMEPAPIANSGEDEIGERVAVIGHPGGIPVKIDDGATVIQSDDARLFVDSDTFEGSSGSGVFTLDGALKGILTAGASDYILDPSGCRRARRIADMDRTGEVATRISVALDDICTRNVVPTDLCVNAKAAGCSTAYAIEEWSVPRSIFLSLALVLIRRRAMGGHF